MNFYTKKKKSGMMSTSERGLLNESDDIEAYTYDVHMDVTICTHETCPMSYQKQPLTSIGSLPEVTGPWDT